MVGGSRAVFPVNTFTAIGRMVARDILTHAEEVLWISSVANPITRHESHKKIHVVRRFFRGVEFDKATLPNNNSSTIVVCL
jgi:hypothetical protein